MTDDGKQRSEGIEVGRWNAESGNIDERLTKLSGTL